MTESIKPTLQMRIMALGIGEGELARYLGRDLVALQGSGDSPERRYLCAVVAALEIMTPEQRETWKRLLDRESGLVGE
jgi:hypothetical protein